MEYTDERQKKQAYLLSEILEAGYNGALFQEFMNSQKSEGFFHFFH